VRLVLRDFSISLVVALTLLSFAAIETTLAWPAEHGAVYRLAAEKSQSHWILPSSAYLMPPGREESAPHHGSSARVANWQLRDHITNVGPETGDAGAGRIVRGADRAGRAGVTVVFGARQVKLVIVAILFAAMCTMTLAFWRHLHAMGVQVGTRMGRD